MTRRDALFRLTALLGGTIFGAGRFLSGTVHAADPAAALPLSADDLAFLNEVGETILPTTPDSAGAKAADIASFMQEIVRDFYTEDQQAEFLAARTAINAASAARFSGRAFLALNADERHALLLALDRANPQPAYYRMIKQLTLWGYFSSEVGAAQALVHVPVPGMFQGCIDVAPDAKAWST